MKTKIETNYCYTGLGFAVELEQVEMVWFEGQWHAKVDVHKVADEIISLLATKKARLTGNEIKFIRSYFDLSLREFGATVIHESHMAASKWEKKGDEVTAMNANTEQVIRLYIIEQLLIKRKQSKSGFYKLFVKSKQFLDASGEENLILQVANS